MSNLRTAEIGAWEDEGGATPAPPVLMAGPLTGTDNQIEWAQRIRSRVAAEFDRVAALFRGIAGKQDRGTRTDTEAIVAIVEEKRLEVLGRGEAGYFIHDWQEITDQVRQMVLRDPRYLAIQSSRPKRRRRSAAGLDRGQL